MRLCLLNGCKFCIGGHHEPGPNTDKDDRLGLRTDAAAGVASAYQIESSTAASLTEGLPRDVFARSGDDRAEFTRTRCGRGLGYARVQVLESPLGLQAARATLRRATSALVDGFRRLSAWHREPARSQPAA
jgi:hypothetical protein